MIHRMFSFRLMMTGLILAVFVSGSGLAQQPPTLPDSLEQLIEMKTGLLEDFAALRKAGNENEAIDVLKTIVDIHRKGLRVAKAESRPDNIIVQLRDVFANDGEYLSDELLKRSEYAASAGLRKEIEAIYAGSVGPNHSATQIMHWKAVTAEKLQAASKEQQVGYQVALGNKQQAVQAMKNGQADVAEQFYLKAIEGEVAVLGNGHHDVALDLNELGRAQLALKKYDVAEKTMLRSLEAREASTGKDLRYATTLFNLARVCQNTRRFKDAENYYLAAAEIEEPILGSNNKSFQQTLGQLAALYRETGDSAKLAGIQQRIAAADPLNTALSHLPRGTFAAAMIEPSKLQQDPGLELLPYEVITAFGQDELQFDPLTVDAAVVFVTLPIVDSANFGVAFRMRDGVETKFPWDEGSEIVEFQGQQYLKEPGSSPQAMCAKQFDDGVIVLGTEETVRQCLTNAAETPVVNMLKADRGRGQLVGAANVEVLRPILQAAIAEAPQAPPALENLKSLPDQVDSVQLRLNISGGLNLSFSLNATDAPAAQSTAKTLTDALQFGSQMAMQEMESEFSGDSPVQVATRTYVRRIATKYLGKLQPTVEGTTVNMEIDGMEHTYGPVAVALLLPAVQAAREAAQRTQDRNSLKQIALAMHNYHDTYGNFPAQANYDETGKSLLSWRVHILPFLEEAALYEQFHLDEPWDSDHNLPLADQMPAVFRNAAIEQQNQTVILSFAGQGTFFDGKKGPTFPDFTDGTSNTLMAAEANTDQAVVWTKPQDLKFDPANPSNGLGEIRDSGFQAVFTDGAVRLIPFDIDEDNLRRLIIGNDGEIVEEF